MQIPPIVTSKPLSLARLEFEVSHAALAFFYEAFTPTVTINDRKESMPWGLHFFDLAPGNYTVSASYPWLFMKECGKGTVQLRLDGGDVVKVIYEARMIRYVPGKMTVIRVRGRV
jgi:hypothetical protein